MNICEPTSNNLISLNNLINFFSAPQKYFLENTLGIYLGDQGETLDDCEPFSLDNLESYNLKDDMLHRMIKTTDKKESIVDIYRAKGLLPHGTAGAVLYKENESVVRSFYSKITKYIEPGRQAESVEVDIMGNGWRLKGIVSDLWGTGGRIVRFRIASVKPKDILKSWIIHLASVCSPGDQVKKVETFVIGTKSVCQFSTPDDPVSILDSLIKLYRQGIKTPLHFFPASSMIYAKTLFNKKDVETGAIPTDTGSTDKAIKNAMAEFKGSNMDIVSGEGQSEDIKLCFRHLETPLDDKFISLSTAIWIPVLEHIAIT